MNCNKEMKEGRGENKNELKRKREILLKKIIVNEEESQEIEAKID